ncbi:MAG: (Fe-S)-binding protein [Candidatus Lindowbacteria bacterium]|nr:(Fe-S)-binding protein [Candidatus Lindowbacteria bacterium]
MQKVSMFIPCLADLFMPEIGEASFQLLRHLDLNPTYHKEQTCCGQPLFNSGYIKHAKKSAKHFIEVFRNDDAIVCPSGSCVHMVKHRYVELFGDESAWLNRAQEIASSIYELSQFVVDVLRIEGVGASFDGKAAYHVSCQTLRGLGVSQQARKLMGTVKGAELVDLTRAEACCGFGGKFANDYPEISEALVREKVTHYLESGADVLVVSEPGCLLNIGGYLSRNHPEKKVMHIANFLTQGIRNGDTLVGDTMRHGVPNKGIQIVSLRREHDEG